MPISRLNFNLIGPHSIAGQSAITRDTFIRAIDKLVSGSVFWSGTLDVTASNAASIRLRPLITSEVSGTRIIIAGDFTDTSAGVFQERIAGTPETHSPVYAYIGIAPNVNELGGGTYTNGWWNSSAPYGPNPRWSRYWQMMPTASLTHMFAIESEETFTICGREGTSLYISHAGAILAGFDSGSSEDGRLFGMANSGLTTLITNFWGSATSWPGHLTTAASNHSGFFVVSGSVKHKEWSTMTQVYAVSLAAGFPGTTTTSENSLCGIPIYMTAGSSRLLGQLRQVLAIGDIIAPTGQVVLKGNNSSTATTTGVVFSSLTTVSDGALFLSSSSYVGAV